MKCYLRDSASYVECVLKYGFVNLLFQRYNSYVLILRGKKEEEFEKLLIFLLQTGEVGVVKTRKLLGTFVCPVSPKDILLL